MYLMLMKNLKLQIKLLYLEDVQKIFFLNREGKQREECDMLDVEEGSLPLGNVWNPKPTFG